MGLIYLNKSPAADVQLGEVIRSEKYRKLKITTTKTFQYRDFSDPDEHRERLESLDIGPNRAVLDKTLPQFGTAVLEKWICPYVMAPPFVSLLTSPIEI